MKKTVKNPMTSAQRPMFFGACRRAAFNLGFYTTEEAEEYRKKVLLEEAGVTSTKDLDSTDGFDACMARFAADAGKLLNAINFEIQAQNRRAYVVKVLACQIMQLKGGEESEALAYIDGILKRSNLAPFLPDSALGSFHLDLTPVALEKVLHILATHRRRLLEKHFPKAPKTFDDTVVYNVDGAVKTRLTGVTPDYYKRLTRFTVKIITTTPEEEK